MPFTIDGVGDSDGPGYRTITGSGSESPTPPTARSGVRVAAAGANTLPFARADLNETHQVLVQFKIADASPQMRLELFQAITAALRPVRVNGHAIVCIMTDENVTMTALDTQLLAAQITPTVARALGVTLPT